MKKKGKTKLCEALYKINIQYSLLIQYLVFLRNETKTMALSLIWGETSQQELI